METMAEIINNWKAARIPIEDGLDYTFEKADLIMPNKCNPMECWIIMVLRDKHTYMNGAPLTASFLGEFFTNHQGGDETLRAIETQQFRQWLEAFTNEYVSYRRAGLQQLRDAGNTIEFYP